MTEQIYKKTTKLSKLAKNRPRSLRLVIPVTITELLGLTSEDELVWEIYHEKNEMYAKVYKKE